MAEVAGSHPISTSVNESSWEKSTPEERCHLEISGLKIRTTEAEVHGTPEQEEQEDENGDFSPLEENPSTPTLKREISSDSADQHTDGTPQILSAKTPSMPIPGEKAASKRGESKDRATPNMAGTGERENEITPAPKHARKKAGTQPMK